MFCFDNWQQFLLSVGKNVDTQNNSKRRLISELLLLIWWTNPSSEYLSNRTRLNRPRFHLLFQPFDRLYTNTQLTYASVPWPDYISQNQNSELKKEKILCTINQTILLRIDWLTQWGHHALLSLFNKKSRMISLSWLTVKSKKTYLEFRLLLTT